MKGKISLILMVVLLGLPLVVACAKEAPPPPTAEEPKGEIVIGMLEDLSGPLAAASADGVASFKDCARYINEERGGVLGHQLRISVVDFKMDATLAISGWDRLKDENAVIITCAPGAVVPVITNASQQDHIPLLTTVGSTIEQNYPTEPSYFFGAFPHMRVVYQAAVELMEEDWRQSGQSGSPKVAFDIMSFGTARKIWTKAAKLVAEDKGWEYIITYTPMTPVEVTTQVLQMKQFDADYAFLANVEQPQIAYLKEFERQNFHPKAYSTQHIGTSNVWGAVGEKAAGIPFYSRAPLWWDTDVEGVALARELNAKWHPEVTLRGAPYFHNFFNFFVVAEALERAINKVGYENLNGEAMKEAMETIRDFEPMGEGVGYTWTPNDHRGLPGCLWHQWTKEGTMERVHDWFVFGPMPEEQRDANFWLKD